MVLCQLLCLRRPFAWREIYLSTRGADRLLRARPFFPAGVGNAARVAVCTVFARLCPSQISARCVSRAEGASHGCGSCKALDSSAHCPAISEGCLWTRPKAHVVRRHVQYFPSVSLTWPHVQQRGRLGGGKTRCIVLLLGGPLFKQSRGC